MNKGIDIQRQIAIINFVYSKNKPQGERAIDIAHKTTLLSNGDLAFPETVGHVKVPFVSKLLYNMKRKGLVATVTIASVNGGTTKRWVVTKEGIIYMNSMTSTTDTQKTETETKTITNPEIKQVNKSKIFNKLEVVGIMALLTTRIGVEGSSNLGILDCIKIIQKEIQGCTENDAIAVILDLCKEKKIQISVSLV